jgi:hypothetical protein
MAQTEKTGKQRIQIKIFDVDSGVERSSTEMIVVGPHSFCSCCSSCIPVVEGPGPVRAQQ